MDILAAVQDRVVRHLSRRAEETERTFRSIDAQMAAQGLGRSGNRIARLIEALDDAIASDVEWCFSEARALFPGRPRLQEVVMAPMLREQIKSQCERLIQSSRLVSQAAEFGGAVQEHVNFAIQKTRDRLEGEFRDFEAGIWSPKDKPTSGAVMTSNTITNYGDVHGVQQQAGNSANQSATVNVSDVSASLERLIEALRSSTIAEADRAEIDAEIETIRRETQRARPNLDVMRGAAKGLAALTAGVAGNLLTPYIEHLLRALGVPI